MSLRRSGRKTKANLIQEQREEVEAKLLANDDTSLGVQVAYIENKGRGIKVWIAIRSWIYLKIFILKAEREFVKGEFVVEYAGDLIDSGKAKDLEAKYSMDNSKGCYTVCANWGS